MSVRKLTYRPNIENLENNQDEPCNIKRSQSRYHPQTRFEKIRASSYIYPVNTQTKIVFQTNKYGNGFKSEPRAQDYSKLKIQQMKDSVDRVCYQTWKLQRQHLQAQSFGKEEHVILLVICLVVACLVSFFVVSQLNFFQQTFFFSFAIICVVLAALIVVLAIYIFTRSHKQIDFDGLMMFNIKNRLALLNKEENQNTNNNPRFEWSCNKEATWIAIKILQNIQSDDQEE